jgi:hypothetical protein
MKPDEIEDLLSLLRLLGEQCDDFSLRVVALENTLGSGDRERYDKELTRLRARSGGLSNNPASLAALRAKLLPTEFPRPQ